MKKVIIIFMALLLSFVSITGVSAEAQVVASECGDVSPYEYDALLACQISSYAAAGNLLYDGQVNLYKDQIINVTRSDDIKVSEINLYYNLFKFIFVGLLILITVLTGYKFMTADEPIKREEAKKTFKYIVLSGVMVALLPIILSLVYNLSTDLTKVTFSLSSFPKSVGDFHTSNFSNPGLSGVSQEVTRLSQYNANIPYFAAAAKSYVIAMNARHMLVLLLLSLAPMILFFYIYAPLNSYGKLLTYLLVSELFYPVLCVIVLHFAFILANDPIDYLMLSGGLFLCMIIQVILLSAALFKASMHFITHIKYSEEESS